MSSFAKNLSAFIRDARACLKAYKLATDSHTQPIKSKYARQFLHDAEIDFHGPDKEQIAALPPAIYVANHASLLDALLVCAFFEIDLRILAKSTLFHMPVVGNVLKREKHIKVYRGKNAHERNRQIREQIQNALANNASVFMFPEGSRTPDGQIKEFKLGAFYNAIQTHTPIIPVAIHGTFKAMPKTGLTIHPGPCRLEILAPIFPPESILDERAAAIDLSNRAKSAIQKALDNENT